MSITVADQLVAYLTDIGVQRIDAVRRSGGSTRGGIDWIQMRHEEAAAFAVGADAQVTGRLAVCAGSCGPGNTHLINGLYDAHRSGARPSEAPNDDRRRRSGPTIARSPRPQSWAGLPLPTGHSCDDG